MNRFNKEGCTPRRYRLPCEDVRALRCYGGGGGGSSASTTTNNTRNIQTTVTGAQAASSTGDNAPVAGAGATQLAAGGNLTVNTSTDPKAFETIQNIVGAALNTTSQTQQAITASQNASNDALNMLTSKVLTQDQATAANTASGGQTNNNSTMLYVVLAAVAGVLGLGFFAFKKK